MTDKYIFERNEYGNPSVTTEVEGVQLDWFMTCGACPEQYDVFIGDKQVGYVRLRGAALRAAYPNVEADYSFEHFFSEPKDYWKGCFDNDNERDYWLDIIGKHLYNKFLKSETVP